MEFHAGHGELQVLAVQGRKADRDRGDRPRLGPRLERRDGDFGRTVLGGDRELGGDRMLAIVDDLQVEMVEGDRLGQVDVDPRAELARRPESWAPHRRRIPVQRCRGSGAQVPGKPSLRVRHDPRGLWAADETIDLVVGDEGVDPGRAGEGEGPGIGQDKGSVKADLGVLAGRVGRDTLAGEQDHQAVGGGRGSGAPQHVLGQVDQFGGRDVGHPDFGESRPTTARR